VPGTIDSRHGRRNVSRNGPTSRIRTDLLEKTPIAQAWRQKWRGETSTGFDARPEVMETAGDNQRQRDAQAMQAGRDRGKNLQKGTYCIRKREKHNM